MKKVLILGGSGLVGFTLVKQFRKNGWWVTTITFRREVKEAHESLFLDLSNVESFNELPDLNTYDLVVNSVAITNVSSNELRFKEALSLHVLLSRLLAKEARKYIYISTLAVYSDTNDYESFRKIDLSNWYSKTKFFGEPNSRHLTLRINVIGLDSLTKRSLLEWALDNLKKNKVITGFENQFINPVLPAHVFEVIFKYVENQIEPGIYDLGSNEIISKYSILEVLAQLLGKEKYLKKGRSGSEDLYQVTSQKNIIKVNFNLNDYVSRYLEEIKEA